jgi:hypothetical protein
MTAKMLYWILFIAGATLIVLALVIIAGSII